MKTLKYIFLILILLTLVLPNYGQDNTVIPERTPEQEAAKQTEKLQQELNLNQDQTKQVYEINLKYARERQVSNTRSAAMERMKNKNAAIERVLDVDQNYRLQTKRYERTTIEIPSGNRSTPSNSPGYRSPSDYRSNQSVRVPSTDNNLRSNYRSSAPNQGSTQQNQTLRRSTTTPSYTPRVLQPSTRSSSGSGSSYSAPRQTVTPTSPPQNNSSTRSQSTPSSSTPRRTETPTTTNRR